MSKIDYDDLPDAAKEIMKKIDEGGSFPHAQDGTIFKNDRNILPAKEMGYYKEYTVPTPGIQHRGTRRIVTGKGGEKYYTSDHYKTFSDIMVTSSSGAKSFMSSLYQKSKVIFKRN